MLGRPADTLHADIRCVVEALDTFVDSDIEPRFGVNPREYVNLILSNTPHADGVPLSVRSDCALIA